MKQLMDTVRLLKIAIAILFVSHKLEELFELCDRVTVMRDGEHILTSDIENMNEIHDRGHRRTLENQYPKAPAQRGEVLIKVENLSQIGVPRKLALKPMQEKFWPLQAWWVLAVQKPCVPFAAEKPDSGKIYIKGKEVSFKNPGEAIRSGLAFLTEDRKGQGLVLSESVKTNLILPT